MRWFLVFFLFAAPAWADFDVPVIDGDTIGWTEGVNLRLQGIDAPEMDQTCIRHGTLYPCGEEAKQALVDFVAEGEFICRRHKNRRDRYGRYIGICWIDGVDVNYLMVRSGWALAYRKYSTVYVEAEEKAKEEKLGMWAGEFTEPWEWRAGR